MFTRSSDKQEPFFFQSSREMDSKNSKKLYIFLFFVTGKPSSFTIFYKTYLQIGTPSKLVNI